MNRVAITGFGVCSPVGTGVSAFWHSLRNGISGISKIESFDCETFDVQFAGQVKEKLVFDEDVMSIASLDIKIGFAYAACRQALENAGIEKLDCATLLHLGTSLESFDLQKVIREGNPNFRDIAIRNLANPRLPLQIPLDTAANLICRKFGTPKRSLTNCSACAASAQAIGHGFREVRSGRIKKAVCGGFDSMVNPLGVGGFQLLGALTVDNDRGASACRPFDASRTGTVLGEGAAVFVLEPLDKALAEGKNILAEICGYGSSLDAFNLSAPDPEGDGAVRAMFLSIGDAGIDVSCINHINAHGTGTWLNDQVEAAAIRKVFAGFWEKIPVSSTKSMTGHMIGAAGAVEAGASLLPLVLGVMPPNPNLKKFGKDCELNHVTGLEKRFAGEYVLSNSFGFGGQNASLVFRRYNG
ncbi:MAG: beta-ketoacyl-[acyl-carrier-protein] synthase family protein [Victivallales bacterium]